MNENFLINICNSNELEKNRINLNKTNTYCYWCDKEELKKITLNTIDNYSHISCFFSLKNDKLTNLVNNEKYVLIFIRTPKILYGIIKVESLIIKSIPEKSYLEDDDIEYTKELLSNKSIEINADKYNKLIKDYKWVEVPKMFIIKFKHIYFFEYEIAIKKFNDYLMQQIQTQTPNQTQFKYPNKVHNKQMEKMTKENFLPTLLNFIDRLNNQNKIILELESELEQVSNTTSETNSNLSDLSVLTETNKEISKFSIPVLWNGCEIIKNMIINETKPKKKLIISHYTNCAECEIIDNNEKPLSLTNKTLVYKKIQTGNESGTGTGIEIFDVLIDKYSNVENFIMDKSKGKAKANDNNVLKTCNFELEKNKINIISCIKSSSVYNKCLLIIE